MSIHVKVSGNPVYLDKSKVFLTDIETAKKNEWMRRRKIRLQQAREQAKDLAQAVRKKVSTQENVISNKEKEKIVTIQKKNAKAQIEALHEEYEKCLSDVGSGHQLASLQSECDALLREKEDLRKEIARARGAVAEERLKAEKCLQKEKVAVSLGHKHLARKVEDFRSNLVSKLPPVKSTIGQKITTKAQVHRGAEEDSITYEDNRSGKGPKIPEGSKSRSIESQRIRNKRKPPSLSDCEDDDSCESDDDSDVTWPPRSARVVKEPIPSPKIKLYDHNTRVTKECPKVPYHVIYDDPSAQPNMSSAIADEEKELERKENLDILARREKMIRGSRALRKEREKAEAEKILKEIDELERRRKIQMANTRSYPSTVHEREDRSEDSRMPSRTAYQPSQYIDKSNCEDIPDDMKTAHETKHEMPTTSSSDRINIQKNIPPFFELDEGGKKIETEKMLEDLISKLKEARAKKQRSLENRFGVSGLKETDVPLWIPHSSGKEDYVCKDSPPDRVHLVRNLDDIRESPEERRETSPLRIGRSDKNVSARHEMEEHGISNTQGRSSPDAKQTSPVQRDRRGHNIESHSPERIDRNGLCEEENIDKENSRSPHKMSPVLAGQNRNQNDILSLSELERECERQFQRLLEDTLKDDNSQAEENIKTCEESQPEAQVKQVPSCETVSSTTDSTSQADTLHSSSTYEGVKVVVKVKDICRKRRSKSPTVKKVKNREVQTSLEDSSPKTTSWNSNEVQSSSTSYMSPPSKLSPVQHSLLRSILTRIDAKTRNPKLHSYINRLLAMSRESVENLPISSVSDVSISSSVFEQPEQLSKTENEKLDVSCQAGSSLDDSCQEEVLKFSELAKCYADRLKDLAGMLNGLNLLPSSNSRQRVNDDTSYLSPPDFLQQSVRLSDSVQAGIYPRPADLSDIPTSIQPHPTCMQSRPPPSRIGHFRKTSDDLKLHDLSTIQEAESGIEKGQIDPSNIFDPDVSSINGTPHKKESGRSSARDSAASSLCLLDEKDISSLLGSSSEDFEEVFRSLGISWALPTVRKTRESRKLSSSSSGRGPYSHSTPLGLSPVKQSPAKAGPSSSKRKSSSSGSNKIAETDSLTPPSYSLNIPRLTQNFSEDSEKKHC